MSVRLERIEEKVTTVADLENGAFFCFDSEQYYDPEEHAQVWRKHQFNYSGQMIDVLVNSQGVHIWTYTEEHKDDKVIQLEAGDVITLTLETSDRC